MTQSFKEGKYRCKMKAQTKEILQGKTRQFSLFAPENSFKTHHLSYAHYPQTNPYAYHHHIAHRPSNHPHILTPQYLLPRTPHHLSARLKARRHLRARTGRWILSRAHILTLRHAVPSRTLLPWTHILLLLLLHVLLLRWPILALLHNTRRLTRSDVLRLLHIRARRIRLQLRMLSRTGRTILHTGRCVKLTVLHVLSTLQIRRWALSHLHLRRLRALLALLGGQDLIVDCGGRRSALWE